ncbi:MAG: DUF4142 domain-containing protein [Isosphaeraceae bacterium]|nr:DUF4142 domain-containing protein [Isosphaeraceae bacterium]
MRRTKRYLVLEALEDKTLLSGAHKHVVHHLSSHRPAPAVGALATGTSASPAQDPTTLPTGDVQVLQQEASGGALETTLVQLAALMSNRSDVQQFATLVATDDQTTEVTLASLGSGKNVFLPHDIEGSDQATAKSVLQAVNTTNFDRAFATAMVQIEQADINRLQQLTNTTQDADVKAFAQAALALDQKHLTAAQALLSAINSGGTSTVPSPSPMSGSSTLSTADQQFLRQFYSGSLLHQFLSQVVALQTSRTGLQRYALKLVNDHAMEDDRVLGYAMATNTSLPATLQGMDQTLARQVLQNLNTNPNGAETTYLNEMVTTHQMDIQNNQQEINSTSNLNLRQLAMEDIPTDYLHMVGAQFLLGVNPLAGFPGFANAGVTNVHVTFRHPGNGSLVYNVTFDSGGFRFKQRYSLTTSRIRGARNLGPGLTDVQAINLFLQSLYSRVNSGSTGGSQGGITSSQ